MRILALSPHPDDAEIGCGASLVRFLREGHEVRHVIVTPASNVNGTDVGANVRFDEARKAQAQLGIPVENFYLLSFRHRELYKDRREILDSFLCIREEYQPELIFMPCVGDLHQDHEVVTKEALRVFKGSSILGYEMVRNNLQFKAQSFIKVTEDDLVKKQCALHEYRTQSFRPYMSPNFIRSLAVTRGVQIDAKFAEAFEVIRWVQ